MIFGLQQQRKEVRAAAHQKLTKAVEATVASVRKETKSIIEVCRALTRDLSPLTPCERAVLDAAAAGEGIDCPNLRGAGLDFERVQEMAEYLRATKPEACRQYETPQKRQEDTR